MGTYGPTAVTADTWVAQLTPDYDFVDYATNVILYGKFSATDESRPILQWDLSSINTKGVAQVVTNATLELIVQTAANWTGTRTAKLRFATGPGEPLESSPFADWNSEQGLDVATGPDEVEVSISNALTAGAALTITGAGLDAIVQHAINNASGNLILHLFFDPAIATDNTYIGFHSKQSGANAPTLQFDYADAAGASGGLGIRVRSRDRSRGA